jgi:hypothetical protein
VRTCRAAITIKGGDGKMHGPFGSRVRAAGVTLVVAGLVATITPVSSVALATGASPEPGVSPVAASTVVEAIHRWPGARPHDNPAGLYAWDLVPGSHRWMHKVPETYTDSAPNSVELTFHAAAATDEPQTLTSPAVSRSWWDGQFDQPAQVLELREEVWLLDVEGTRVAILLDSYPDTDPALLAEARAVIESVVAEPTESGHQLVFRLLEGWDSG